MTEPAPPTRSFVLGMAGDSGELDASALYDAADALGFTSTRIRLTLRRFVDASSITVEGCGRAAVVLPDVALSPGFAGPDARRVHRTLLGALREHDLVTRANVSSAHEAAIERALGRTD